MGNAAAVSVITDEMNSGGKGSFMDKLKKYKADTSLLRRILVLVLGLLFAAMGVSLSVKANLGTSPMGCCPAAASSILSECFGIQLSVGNCMWIMLSIFVLMQIILLRRDFEWAQLLQLVIAYIYGFFNDFTAFLIKNLAINNYLEQWIVCAVSMVFLGFGVFLEVKADLIPLSGEGLILALTKVTKVEFHKMKITVDCTMVALAAISSLILLHRLSGVREGTVAAAVLVGMIVSFFMKHFGFVGTFLKEKAQENEGN